MFEIGQKVRIKQGAFPASNDEADVGARGKVGVILHFIEPNSDPPIYMVEVDGIGIVHPFPSEIEPA